MIKKRVFTGGSIQEISVYQPREKGTECFKLKGSVGLVRGPSGTLTPLKEPFFFNYY